MSRSMKKGVCVLMTLLFLFTLVLPVFAMEIETGQEPANDAAQDFIDTVNTLDRDAIPAFAAADMAALHIGAARHIRQFLIGQGGEQFFFLFGVEGLGVNGG